MEKLAESLKRREILTAELNPRRDCGNPQGNRRNPALVPNATTTTKPMLLLGPRLALGG
jgi:hypothetical protein